MLDEIKKKIEAYNAKNDVHKYQLILDAAKTFIDTFHEGGKE
jgi:hypothetical protein